MSKSSWRAELAGGALLVLLGAGLCRAEEGKSPYVVFPSSPEVFRLLLADPREIQLTASYYRLNGSNDADIALGRSWGLTRWYSEGDRWAFQWDVEAMAFSRFKLSGAVNEFQVVDFFGRLPIEVRRGIFSGKFMLLHESSHLGDDFIRASGDPGFRYSTDGTRGLLSLEPASWLRLYGGGEYLLHTIPAPQRWGAQGGAELTSGELGLWRSFPSRAYLAEDLQAHERVHWNLNSRTTLGLRIGYKDSSRSMRVYVGYFTGHSPYGQFFAAREHYSQVAMSFDL